MCVTHSRYKSLLARVPSKRRLTGHYVHVLWQSLTFISMLYLLKSWEDQEKYSAALYIS